MSDWKIACFRFSSQLKFQKLPNIFCAIVSRFVYLNPVILNKFKIPKDYIRLPKLDADWPRRHVREL